MLPGEFREEQTPTDDFSEPDWCSGSDLIKPQMTTAYLLWKQRWKRGLGLGSLPGQVSEPNLRSQ